MFRLAGLAAAALFLAAPAWAGDAADPLRPGQAEILQSPAFPPQQASPADSPQKDAPRAERLQPLSRLELVRYVSGEFATAVRPLPGGKKGFRIEAGKPVEETTLRQAVANFGAAAARGDTVQVTKIEFHDREIRVDINGGGKGRTRFRDRVQVSVGGLPTVKATPTHPGLQKIGSTLILDFGRPLPDMTPDDLKKHLAIFLDFEKQRSAAVTWFETLAPEFQQAIREKRAVVGMDREMVTAALGRPARKVRSKDEDGWEIEDWIYGHPPGKTIFVTFGGDKVTTVKEFN